MILCLDAGNTRVKWGVAHQDAPVGVWLAHGACGHADVQALAALPPQFPQVNAVWLSNVAGAGVEAAIRTALAPWQTRIHLARSEAVACGVNNTYRQPDTLGVDRWCALLAVWQQQQRAALVVSLGTATTVDALDDAGRFLGGMILPGMTLMRQSLAERTAQLPAVPAVELGADWHWPQATDEAIQAGALRATLGAIEQAWQRLAQTSQQPPVCVLTGGAAEQIQAGLSMPHTVLPHAVLNGLRRLAQSSSIS